MIGSLCGVFGEVKGEVIFIYNCGKSVYRISENEILYFQCEGKKIRIIGGICAGSEIVANALDISSNIDKTIVFDDHVVLSPGNEYVDFALTLGKVANIYDGEEDYKETIDILSVFNI